MANDNQPRHAPQRGAYEPHAHHDMAEHDAAAAFVLTNHEPKRKQAAFCSAPATQRKLLDGLDCLPGQHDLF
ncbi:hypothetical protein [Botrimarina mediterranea]|uniref:Uncharacterized protein n=1 Tax=Botrimarina mediterranea TaxID=2528022 RepID=A0A518KC76_9BACT|nr:hypothetical protein [Botrimarina mediterranea]QDV75400.1 hypothetical protein Spa11_36170 [Botrimarina mediterranea]